MKQRSSASKAHSQNFTEPRKDNFKIQKKVPFMSVRRTETPNTQDFIVAIDQGTTSSRSLLFDKLCNITSQHQIPTKQYFPRNAWVEQNPLDIWDNTLETLRQTTKLAGLSSTRIAAMGISNQRETTVIWHRETGIPIYNAIIWLDRRTAEDCRSLELRGFSKLIQDKTGLILDPYFSASKISWILSNVDGARSAADNGELAFGTIDSWLLWNLTNGTVHATDITNASRTMLFNINCQDWDSELLDLFEIPKSLLPEVRDCNAYFGSTDSSILGSSIDIYGVAGDQQAAALGQACFTKGMIKSTYGTGCFALFNTGDERSYSNNKLITTIAYRISGKINYALEGSIFAAGVVINWLRDGLNFTESPEEFDKLAESSNLDDLVYLIPAFSGLGAPWWDTKARGAVLGMTLSTGKKEIARAALESVCYQTFDLLRAMQRDVDDSPIISLRVDGGMSKSNWSMQFLADILQIPIDRSTVSETSALGVAWLAASKIGFWPTYKHFAKNWKCQQRFTPQMNSQKRQLKLSGWRKALESIKSSSQII